MASDWQKYKVSKQELIELYINRKLSTVKIGKLYNINPRTINYYIKKYNIKIRNHRDSAIISHHGNLDFTPISKIEKEILIGELLGDGNIKKDKRNTQDCYGYYRHSSQYEQYLGWLASKLPSLRFRDVTCTIHKKNKANGNEQLSYHLDSLVHPELDEIYNMFYDNNHIKHIPADLKLTPTVLRHWFMGDGTAGYFSTGKDSKGNTKRSLQVCIYACAYTKEELENIIIPQLQKNGIKATITCKPRRHRIRISSESFNNFFNYMESTEENTSPDYLYKFFNLSSFKKIVKFH